MCAALIFIFHINGEQRIVLGTEIFTSRCYIVLEYTSRDNAYLEIKDYNILESTKLSLCSVRYKS